MDDDHQPSSGDVSCSICLDLVTDNRGRSRAKLQCGHEFHLDCIGSAFNMKGAMQCPNCRKVENGQWLYANGSTRSFPEFTIDDWIPDEDPYDMGYAEMGTTQIRKFFCDTTNFHLDFIGVHLGRQRKYIHHLRKLNLHRTLVSVVNDFSCLNISEGCLQAELSQKAVPFVADHDLREHHSMFAEQIAASSVPHSYVAYFRPIPPVSSRSINIIDDPNLTNPWNGLRGPNETLNHHIFPAISIQYQSWAPHSSPFSPSSSHVNNVNPASNQSATVRSTRGESNAVVRSRARLFRLVQGSDPRAESSFVASFVPHSPDGTARTHERIQAFHHHQQHSISPGVPSPTVPSFRRFDGPATVPAPPPHDHNAGFYVFPPPGSSDRNTHEAEHPMASHFHGWGREQLPHFPAVFPERDSSWGSSHHPTGSSDSGNRSSSLWHRSWS